MLTETILILATKRRLTNKIPSFFVVALQFTYFVQLFNIPTSGLILWDEYLIGSQISIRLLTKHHLRMVVSLQLIQFITA